MNTVKISCSFHFIKANDFVILETAHKLMGLNAVGTEESGTYIKYGNLDVNTKFI